MSSDIRGRVLDLHVYSLGPRGGFRTSTYSIWAPSRGPMTSSQYALLVPALYSGRGPVVPPGLSVHGTSLRLEASSPPAFNVSSRGAPYCAQDMDKLLLGRASVNDHSTHYRCRHFCVSAMCRPCIVRRVTPWQAVVS
jgi:hypothetical protein